MDDAPRRDIVYKPIFRRLSGYRYSVEREAAATSEPIRNVPDVLKKTDLSVALRI